MIWRRQLPDPIEYDEFLVRLEHARQASKSLDGGHRFAFVTSEFVRTMSDDALERAKYLARHGSPNVQVTNAIWNIQAEQARRQHESERENRKLLIVSITLSALSLMVAVVALFRQ